MKSRYNTVSLDGSDWLLGSGAKPDTWLKAEVPGDVRSTLVKLGRIPDPYVDCNSYKSDWVPRLVWWYKKTFSIPKKFKGKICRLVFEGVDYNSVFWLNGKLLGSHSGGMTRIVFDVTKIISCEKENILLCRTSTPHTTEGMKGTLKTGVSLGGDHNPAMVTLGIWKPVRLEFSGSAVIDSPFAKVRFGNRYKTAAVEVSFDAFTRGRAKRMKFLVEISPENFSDRKFSGKKHAVVAVKPQRISVAVKMKNPALWWPWELGRPNLYKVTVRAVWGGEILDEEIFTVGLRKVEFRRNNAFVKGPLPSIHSWFNSFVVKPACRYEYNYQEDKKRPAEPAIGSYNWNLFVNGRRLFIRGGSCVPFDLLYGRTDDARYAMILDAAKEANLNYLRIWGTGIAEKKEFYDYCDKIGMMVLQDFPTPHKIIKKAGRLRFFKGAARQDREFLKFFRREMSGVAENLRNHPCIVMWDGGNELLDVGNPPDHPVFKILRKICRQKIGKDVEFRRACPEPPEMHSAWHYDFDHYGRYNSIDSPMQSETGCSSLPCYESLKRAFTSSAKAYPASRTWDRRLPGAGGYRGHISIYTQHVFGTKLVSLRETVWATQVVQAEANRYIVESFRRKSPGCSGFVLWELNEMMPTICWSLVDWYGRRKISHQFVRKACESLIACAEFEKNVWSGNEKLRAGIWAVNDLEKFSGGLHRIDAELVGRNGECFAKKSGYFRLKSGSRKIFQVRFDLPEKYAGLIFLKIVLSNPAGKKMYVNSYPMQVLSSPQKPLARLLIVSDDLFENDPLKSFFESLGIRVTTAKDTLKRLILPAKTAQELRKKFDVIMFGPAWELKRRLGNKQMNVIKKAVRMGTGAFFTGSDIKSKHFTIGGLNCPMPPGTPLAEISPVTVTSRKSKKDLEILATISPDFLENRQKVVKDSRHPVLEGLDWRSSRGFLGESVFKPKKGTKNIITANRMPILVQGNFGRGRVIAYSGAYGSQIWEGTNLLTWKDCYPFLARNVLFAAGKGRQVLRKIDKRVRLVPFRGLADVPEARLNSLGYKLDTRR